MTHKAVRGLTMHLRRTGMHVLTIVGVALNAFALVHADEAPGNNSPTADVKLNPGAVGRIAAFAPGTRILFQGDSITDGNRGRNADPNHILGHGYVFIVAAKFGAAFPEAKLEFLNRGISGHTVLDLQKRWHADTLALKPDVLSILIGVNDNRRNVPFDEFELTYDKLLTDAKTANPNLKLVLCEPFIVNHLATTPQHGSPNADIIKRQEIVAKLAKKHQAAFVRFQTALDKATERAPAKHWIWDDVHPTYAGHQILADEWERTVREVWK